MDKVDFAGTFPRLELEDRIGDVDRFQAYIRSWSDSQFGGEDIDGNVGALNHLEDEVKELKEAHKEGDLSKLAGEYADCFILLFQSAHRSGFLFSEVLDHMRHKMAINESREWGPRDSRGVCHHVSSGDTRESAEDSGEVSVRVNSETDSLRDVVHELVRGVDVIKSMFVGSIDTLLGSAVDKFNSIPDGGVVESDPKLSPVNFIMEYLLLVQRVLLSKTSETVSVSLGYINAKGEQIHGSIEMEAEFSPNSYKWLPSWGTSDVGYVDISYRYFRPDGSVYVFGGPSRDNVSPVTAVGMAQEQLNFFEHLRTR